MPEHLVVRDTNSWRVFHTLVSPGSPGDSFRVNELVRDGSPNYAWSYADRHVWKPARETACCPPSRHPPTQSPTLRAAFLGEALGEALGLPVKTLGDVRYRSRVAANGRVGLGQDQLSPGGDH